jgi:peptidyl-dipeptidase Dcp
MNSLVKQSHLEGLKPVVVNNLNLVKGEPTLMTFDEVNTLFHEFGHALHGLFSDVRFPRFSGTAVPRDFVEYPSQVNEMWATNPEILANSARHHESGEPMPRELVDRMLAAQKFNQGFATVEYLAATLLDWAWHTAYQGGDPYSFEERALAEAGVALKAVPPRYHSTYFAHIWSSGYAAGYYSYIWSEVLDADTVEWFAENGGLTRANGDRFRGDLLSKGGSLDSMAAFRAFRGRDPEIAPLLTRRGLG